MSICEEAPGRDQYWIVSHNSDGNWFAKERVDGERRYTVELRNGSGTRGEQRSFLIVAARSATARRSLRDNLQADIDQTPFDRTRLPEGTDFVSDAVPTTS